MATSLMSLRLLVLAWMLGNYATVGSDGASRTDDADGTGRDTQEPPQDDAEPIPSAFEDEFGDADDFPGYDGDDGVPPPEFGEDFYTYSSLPPRTQFEVALQTDSVTLNQIAEVQNILKWAYPGSTAEHRAYADLLMNMIASFQYRHGMFIDQYYCINTVAGAVRTTRGSLYMTIPPADPEIARLLTECERLAQEIEEVLEGSDLELASKRVFSVIRGLLALLDNQIWERHKAELNSADYTQNRPQMAEPISSPPSLNFYSEALRHAREYFEDVKRRNVINLYFSAALGVALVMFVVVIALSGLMWLGLLDQETLWNDSSGQNALVVCLVAGAGGAIISVLERVRRWDLVVVGVPTKSMIIILGAARLLIGGTFALLLYAGIQADLIPIKIPEQAVEIYFWLIIGFIAGFSERFAPDALAVTEQQLSARPGPVDQTGAGANA